MKARFTLIPLVGILMAGLLLAFASGAKAAPSDLTYTGELKSSSDTAWTLTDGTLDKVFQVDQATIIPPFYTIKDTVVTTYTEISPGVFLSKEFKVWNSDIGNPYTYTGTLTTGDNGVWTVGEYSFLQGGVTLPFNISFKDTVEVTFKIAEGNYVATKVELVETYVGTKVESNRCENRFKDQPAVYRLAKEFNEKPEKITEYFCKGFGIGEIKLAYKTANESYTAAMLLAMRANGKSWGEIKQLVASTPVANPETPVTTISAGSPATNTNTGGTANHGKNNNGNGQGKVKPDHGKKP